MTIVMMMVVTVMVTVRKRMTRMVLRRRNTSQGPGIMPGTCHSRFLNRWMTLGRKYNCCHFKYEETESQKGSRYMQARDKTGFLSGEGSFSSPYHTFFHNPLAH